MKDQMCETKEVQQEIPRWAYVVFFIGLGLLALWIKYAWWPAIKVMFL